MTEAEIIVPESNSFKIVNKNPTLVVSINTYIQSLMYVGNAPYLIALCGEMISDRGYFINSPRSIK